MAKTKKILIAEDEQVIANAMALKLKTSGFEVKIASNGQEALDILSKEKFDLLLLDLIMPQLDGFGVLEALKKKKNKMPVVVTSNLGQEEDKEHATKLGAVGYLIKSDTPLYQIIEFIQKKLK